MTGHSPCVLQLEQRLLPVVLRGRVGAAWLDGGVLVVHARRQPVVQRAGGGEDHPLDPALDAGLAERLGRDRVHLPVGLGVVLGGGVVGKAGEVDHAVHAVEGARGDVAHVRHHELDAVAHSLERLLAPVEPIEHSHVVAAIEQPLGEDRPDVARPARHEDGAEARGLGGEPVAAPFEARAASGFIHRAYASEGGAKPRTPGCFADSGGSL